MITFSISAHFGLSGKAYQSALGGHNKGVMFMTALRFDLRRPTLEKENGNTSVHGAPARAWRASARG